jgi:peptidoglycan/LPS O-acetylase OafA/YrhL
MSHYRADIDGLRAIAVLLVIAYHAGIPGLGGGFVGVDVFFVISGFLITQLLLAELDQRGKISLSRFYERRFKRLLPALFTVILCTVVISVIFLPGFHDSRKYFASVRWAVGGAANIFFLRNTGGYFDDAKNTMPFLHLWSLGIEEQFYLFWPILLTLVYRHLRKKTVWALSLLIIFSFLAAQHLVHNGQSNRAFYLMPDRAWELGIGALLVFLPPCQKMLRPFYFIGAIALLILPALGYSAQTPFPGITALLPVLSAALFIWSGNGSGPLANPFLVHLGLLSYGWYLWHWPLLALCRTWNFGNEPALLTRLGCIAISFGLAEVSSRWIEDPIRKSVSLKKMRPRTIIIIGIIGSILLALFSYGALRLEKKILRYRLGDQLVEQIEARSSLGKDCFSREDIATPRCNFSFRANGALGSNWVQTNDRLILWGDSHAGSYFPMIEKIGRQRKVDVTLYCTGNTPPLLNSPIQIDWLRRAQSPAEVGNFSEAVFWDLDRKIRKEKLSSIVLVARWSKYPDLEQRLDLTLRELLKLGIQKIVLIGPYPEFNIPIVECLQRFPGNCMTFQIDLIASQQKILEKMQSVASRYSQVRVLDPLSAVCQNGICPQILDGMPVVIDDNHPSLVAALKVEKYFHSELDWLFSVVKK